MEIERILKQLKHIAPDEAYTLRSRNVVLATLPMDERPSLTPWQVITHSLQFGSAMTLAGLLLVLVLGGFSTWQFLSPFRMTSLDPASLRAEAEAVDVQLEMTNLNYAEPKIAAAALMTNETTTTSTAEDATPAPAKAEAEAQAKDLGLMPATTSADGEDSVADVLNQLAE